MSGVIRPSIYLPAHLLCDMRQSHAPSSPALRHMLLHELVHYKQKDALTNGLINLFHLLYWSNPAVWFAVNEVRNDREIACDAAVLKVLGEKMPLITEIPCSIWQKKFPWIFFPPSPV